MKKVSIELDFYTIFSEIISEQNISKKLRDVGETSMSLKLFQKTVKIPQKNIEELSVEISEKLYRKPLVVKSERKNDGEPIMICVKFDLYKQEFSFKVLPTWSEVQEATTLLNTSIIQETYEMIRKLSQTQSELLIDNVLSSEKLEWIKKFQLSPTKSDDGGKDFSNFLLIKENNQDIGFDGYGKMVECVGQIKHYKEEIKPEKIREFIGAMKIFRKKFGIYISINGYSKKAIKTAKESQYVIFCWDAMDLAKIMVQKEIGIKKIRIKTGKQPDEEWWNEIRRES